MIQNFIKKRGDPLFLLLFFVYTIKIRSVFFLERRQVMDGEKEEKSSLKYNLTLYLHDLFYILAAFLVVFLLLFRVVIVSGPSMLDTLHDGDFLFLVGNLL